nr:hypothetical protein [Tanacetum cinerariifolium]
MSNINNNMQTQTSNSLHNAIMEAGSKDRPPMLAPGNYIQWKSRIKRYIDTKPNREHIHYCLENPPYELGWKVKFINDAEGNPTTVTHQVFETFQNVEQVIRDQLNAEVEAVQIILTGIDNDIYSTVDACPNACEMWKAIERLKQGESINVQDLETNLFWEFGLDSEGNPTTPEWQRFVTLLKQSQELKHVSYHKLYDILKQHQHEVNEIRAEKIARVANPLALVAQQQQSHHPHTHPNHFNQTSSTRTHQSATRKREKVVVNSPQPIYDQEPSMVDDDDEDTSKEKEIDKLMALISLSLSRKSTNQPTTTFALHPIPAVQIRITLHGFIEMLGMKDKGVEYGHIARECQKPKRAKDAAYHREKMLLCKQEEAGIQLNAEQADWRDDTDDESDDQELKAHYMYIDSGPIFDKETEQK